MVGENEMQPLTIMLVGAPNVGKSMIFNYLTGMYVTVSNYPGTTVDVSRGKMKLYGKTYEVVDTPGIYSLVPMTDEERVTRELLCDGKSKLVIHVIDAKHICRMSGLTLDLLDAGFPVIVCLNIIDEAERLGIHIDSAKLSQALGAPVVKTSALNKGGLEQLKQTIRHYQITKMVRISFGSALEQAISDIGGMIGNPCDYGISRRLIAIMLMRGDHIVEAHAQREERYGDIFKRLEQERNAQVQKLELLIPAQRQAIVKRILDPCLSSRHTAQAVSSSFIDRLTREPRTGIPILFAVIYIGLYLFVGQLGAGVLVDYVDRMIFGLHLLPVIEEWVTANIPGEALPTLLMGEYGIISLGLRYAVAIILPVVGTFFLAFALLEDSGYLPRLAMLLNAVCSWFGLNGRAVIPLSLGFGCGTMAVMVTRTLESKRERILATFLLSLAIPCSAQLGVMLTLLSRNSIALVLWSCIMISTFVFVGLIANILLPGSRSAFYMELPPIRMPRLKNVCIKAYSRMLWYMKEIIPVFICVSLFLWLIHRVGWLGMIADSLEPALALLGLPKNLAAVFLLGFFRRDYGAAGLYDLCSNGILGEKQLLVAAVGLTLFLPCIAQMVVMVKERGLVISVVMIALIALLSFSIAWLVHVLVNPAWLC